MPGWDRITKILEEEFSQSREEGKDPEKIDALRAEFESAREDESRLRALHEQLLNLPIREDFPFREPSGLAEIKELRPPGRRRFAATWTDAELLDKLHGAWLGRCAGCALGKPVELYMGAKGDLSSWQRQKRYLTAISPEEWPLRDYFPEHSPAEDEAGRLICRPSQREHIAYMETDDDIRYTVLGQIVLNEFGPEFTPIQVAEIWLRKLSYFQVCTAETQAYRNLVIRDDYVKRWPGKPVDDSPLNWHWIVHHLNPYREWIGAQIRVDSYGYACPGHPELAAEFAWRDAGISHVKNGIYGAMFCAAMIAASFATDNPIEIIEAGLAEIPQTSRLYAEMGEVIAICDQHGNRFENFEAVFAAIYALLGHYSPVHTNNNAALCVAALLLSDGDFHRGITLSVMGGWDTDCNGATVGSIVGAICGARAAPRNWTAPLNDTLNSEIAGYHPISIQECARRSLEIARRVKKEA